MGHDSVFLLPARGQAYSLSQWSRLAGSGLEERGLWGTGLLFVGVAESEGYLCVGCSGGSISGCF